MSENVIDISHVSKEYRLGAIGGGTLRGDLQSWIAKKQGKEDPNTKIGTVAPTGANSRFLALDDISFTVKRGEALGIIGHNGAGKSTLLKLLSRVTAPTKGKISYNGRIASMLEVGTGFHPELTGRENVYMNGAILGMTKAEITSKFDEIVAFAEMEQFIDTPVKRYSSGMYVKLAFAVAAHLDSEIMVMDEVLAVGDMKFQQKCLGKMGDASQNHGRTVLYVSHNMNTIRQLCTRCIVLDHGKLVFDGGVENAIGIYSDYNTDNRFFKDYSDYNRPGWLRMSNLRVQSARYTGGTCFFKKGERINVEFKLLYTRPLDKIGLRFELRTKANIPVATSVIMSLPITAGDDIQTVTLSYDFPELVEDEYMGFFTFFASNDMGTNVDVDCVPSLPVIIENTSLVNRLDWHSSAWGNITLPPPRIID